MAHTWQYSLWHFNNTVVGLSRNCSYVDQPVSAPSEESCTVYLVLLHSFRPQTGFHGFLGRERYEDTWASLSTHKVAFVALFLFKSYRTILGLSASVNNEALEVKQK